MVDDFEQTKCDDIPLTGACDNDVEPVHSYKGNPRVCIIQMSLLTPKQPLANQQRSIFYTHCTIKKHVCNVIIDSDSNDNIVLKSLLL